MCEGAEALKYNCSIKVFVRQDLLSPSKRAITSTMAKRTTIRRKNLTKRTYKLLHDGPNGYRNVYMYIHIEASECARENKNSRQIVELKNSGPEMSLYMH